MFICTLILSYDDFTCTDVDVSDLGDAESLELNLTLNLWNIWNGI